MGYLIILMQSSILGLIISYQSMSVLILWKFIKVWRNESKSKYNWAYQTISTYKLNNERTYFIYYFIILKLQVCCAAPFTNNNQDITNYPDFISGNHGTGGDDNRNKPATRKPNPSVSTNINADSPPDIRGHRNLDLLPTNCGPVPDDFRISGGNRTFLFEMPWMVLLAYNSR